MEDDHNLRTAIAVCLSKRVAQFNRDVLMTQLRDYKFVVEECKLCEP